MKNNLHLTLSHIIKNQDSAIGLVEIFQKQMLLGFNTETRLVNRTIYKYPLGTIHHSLVDFLPAVEFNRLTETVFFESKHKNLINNISKEVENNADIENKTIIIKSVYKDEKSIALEAYPSQDILNLASKIANNVETEVGFPKVKGFPLKKPEKFAINIVRFFRELGGTENQILDERIKELNQQLANEPINFELKNLSLVISDDYLSNPNPEVVKFNI